MDWWHSASEIWANAATGTGVLAAGAAAFYGFIINRDRYPRAIVELRPTHRPLADDRTLLQIEVRITNIGKVLLPLDAGTIRVQQILPCEPHIRTWLEQRQAEQVEIDGVLSWPMLAQRTLWREGQDIEPGEQDSVHCDFILPREATCLMIYAYFKNSTRSRKENEHGWSASATYDCG